MVIIENKLFENDGVLIELYLMNDGKPAVRMSDVDAGKTVGITIYPTQERAKAGFDAMVAKVIYYDGGR